MLGVVGYGGGLWHTWFDRDLTLVGRALVRREGRVAQELVRLNRAVCRIPTLAIHLTSGDERSSFKPNLQQHLPPLLATGIQDALQGDVAKRHDDVVVKLAAEALQCDEDEILELELQLADFQPAALIGARSEFVSSGRLDNQGSCYCGTTALIESLDTLPGDASLRVLAMFDHEEVGSLSQQGAQSPFLGDVLRRAYKGLRGADFDAFVAQELPDFFGYGPRAAPELRGPARPEARREVPRRPRDQAQREPAVRDGRRRVRAHPALRAEGGLPAARRGQGRQWPRHDHRTHHGGRPGFENGRRRPAAALDAFLSRDHGRRRRVLRGRSRGRTSPT